MTRKIEISSVEGRTEIYRDADKTHKPHRRMNKTEREHWLAITRHRPFNEWPPHDLRTAEILTRLMARAERELKDPDISIDDIGKWVTHICRLRSSLNLHQVGKGSTQQKSGTRNERGRQIEAEARAAKVDGFHLLN